MLVLAALPATLLQSEAQAAIFELAKRPGSDTSSRSTPETSEAPGQVYLREIGPPHRTLVRRLHHNVALPAGSWSWQAETADRVTVGLNVVKVEPGSEKQPVRLQAVAVPACEVTLGKEGRHRAESIEIASPEHGTIYKVNSRTRPSFRVPHGSFLLIGHGERGLLGVSPLHRCSPTESLDLEVPGPPAGTKHDLVAHFELPDADADPSDALLAFESEPARPGGRIVLPTGVAWMGKHGVAAFKALPAGTDGELLLQHPELRSVRHRLAAIGGGATLLDDTVLRRRPDLTLSIDYRPLAPHDRAAVLGFHCGSRQLQDVLNIDRDSCEQLDEIHDLRVGVADYTFRQLDTGQYLLMAEIGQQVVHSLGSWVLPFLAPEEDDFDEIGLIPLAEHRVFGNLLEDDEPVPGTVSVEYFETEERNHRATFPTDDDLLYNWTYFGYLPLSDSWIRRLPESAHGIDRKKLMGLYVRVVLSACGESGACRVFGINPTIVGDGRLDLDLSGNEVAVTVVDRKTGEPLFKAFVVSDKVNREPGLVFFHGEVASYERRGAPGTPALTDTEGRVQLRLPPGPDLLRVAKFPDYAIQDTEIEVPADRALELTVELDRMRDAPDEGVTFRFPDGTPVARAFLQVFTVEGERRFDCYTSTRNSGSVRFGDGCLDGTTVVLLHPAAAISVRSGIEIDLSRGGEIEVARAPSRPLRARVIAADGMILPGHAIELRYPSFTLDQRDFAAAGSISGRTFIRLSDGSGEIVLRGLDPHANRLPRLAVAGGRESEEVSLAGFEPGEVIELVVE